MYKIVFLTVIVTLLLVGEGILAQDSRSIRCSEDTDGGIDFFKKGTVASSDKNYTDYCSPINNTPQNLLEYFCKPLEPGYAVLETSNQDCSKLGNYKCSDGACVSTNGSLVISSPTGPVIVTPPPETPVTVAVPQPIGTLCEDLPDGAITINPLTKIKTPWSDFIADGVNVTYGCKDGKFVQTRTPIKTGKRSFDITSAPKQITNKIFLGIGKEAFISTLFLATQPVLFFAAAPNRECFDNDNGDPTVQGYVIDGGKRYTDRCKGDDKLGFNRTLQEQVCVPNFWGTLKARTVEVDCLGVYGAQCYGGACMLFEPGSECWDSDNSKPVSQQAIVEGWVIPSGAEIATPDVCEQERGLGADIVLYERLCGEDSTQVYEERVDCDSLGKSRRCINNTISANQHEKLFSARCTESFGDNNGPRSK